MFIVQFNCKDVFLVFVIVSYLFALTASELEPDTRLTMTDVQIIL